MAIAGLVPRAAKRLVGAEAEARARVIFAALLGIGAAAAARPWSPWQLTILVGWDVGAGVFLAAVWWIIARADSRATAALATREDETRASASFLLLCASTISLVGVALALIEAKQPAAAPKSSSGGGGPHRRSLLGREMFDLAGIGRPLRMRTLITTEGRITLYDGTPHGELFDHRIDRAELENRFADSGSARWRAEMTERLARAMMASAEESPRPTFMA